MVFEFRGGAGGGSAGGDRPGRDDPGASAKGNPVEPGYAAKVAAVLDAGTSGVDWVQPTWQVQEEIVHYVTGSTTNSVTNWIRVAGPTGTNALAEGDYVLPGDVFSTDGTNVIDVILEF